jgi:hypothetical protein
MDMAASSSLWAEEMLLILDGGSPAWKELAGFTSPKNENAFHATSVDIPGTANVEKVEANMNVEMVEVVTCNEELGANILDVAGLTDSEGNVTGIEDSDVRVVGGKIEVKVVREEREEGCCADVPVFGGGACVAGVVVVVCCGGFGG